MPADQGLAAALRTQASPMAIATHVKANPNLAGRRFGRELELVTLLEQAPRTLPRQVLTLSDQHPQA